MTTENKQTVSQVKTFKRVSDVLRQPEFHTDARKVELKDIEGKSLILYDVTIRNWSGEDGEKPMCIIYASSEELPDDTFTFLASGKVLVDKFRQLQSKRAFPVLAEIQTVISKDGQPYWDMQ